MSLLAERLGCALSGGEGLYVLRALLSAEVPIAHAWPAGPREWSEA